MAVVFNGGLLCCKALLINPNMGDSKVYGISNAALEFGISTNAKKGLGQHSRTCLKPCHASLFNQQSSFPEANALYGLTIFRDEAKGIICYRTPTGEITCEGIDEGPHFHPPTQYLRFQSQQLVSTKSRNDEAYVNGAGI
ncbi:hypothetical protein O6H91_20G057100 [Diphasiastrum complanatum]|uniref:Uncharacterized protein n=1 Tax=Diphasiastrum complanatum TaxID=34168 RepID=A0ACC2AQJ2_DIPCM|nr:hypothetical protein O6H91_20G057100 [Diphasiastrum complanatum]